MTNKVSIGIIAAVLLSADLSMGLALVAGALVTAGAILITLEHQRVKRVERRWLAEHQDRSSS